MRGAETEAQASPGPLAPRSIDPARLFVRLALALLAAKVVLLLWLHDLPLVGDEARYLALSEEFFSRYWKQHDYWAPLQTAFLASVRALVGEGTEWVARLVQLVVHTLTGWLVFRIAREIEDERLGLLAGVLYLVLPEVVSMSYLLFAETWSGFWFFASAFAYLVGLRQDRARHLAIAGLAFGFAALFRSISLYFGPFLLLHLWLFGPRKRTRRLALAGTFLVAACLPVSVQTTKNLRLSGDFLAIATSGGENAWRSHNSFEPPHWDFRAQSGFVSQRKLGFPDARPQVQHGTPAERQAAELRRALRFIAENPGLSARRTVEKVRNLFYPALFFYRNAERADEGSFVRTYLDTRTFRAVASLSYIGMTMLAVAGLLYCREKTVRSWCLLLLVYHVAMNGLFFAVSRYRMAFVPVLVIFMAWALLHRREIWQQRRSARGIALACIWVVMIANWWAAYLRML